MLPDGGLVAYKVIAMTRIFTYLRHSNPWLKKILSNEMNEGVLLRGH